MTHDTQDGGPAFPGERVEGLHNVMTGVTDFQRVQYAGMSLRDYMAAHAEPLPEGVGLHFFECLVGREYDAEFGSIEHWQFVADAEAAWRFLHADAMLAARGKP